MSTSIQQLIAQAAQQAGVPPALALAQAQKESSLNPNAYNAKSGATGLFQLEPATAAQLGVTNPLDPAQSAAGGLTYLAQLYNQFGSWDLALAAYDWGPGNLSKALGTYGSAWLAHAPAETQNYVATILGNSGVPAGVPDLSTAPPASSPDTIDISTIAPDLLDVTAGASPGPNLFLLAFLAFGAYIAFDLLAER